MAGNLDPLVVRLEAVTSRLEAMASKSGSGGTEANEEIVSFYDKFLSENVAKCLKISSEIGGDVGSQAKLVDQAFKAQRDFLVLVSKHQCPSANVLQTLLTKTSQAILAVQEFREKNRRSNYFNHLSSWSEGIPALGWVTVVKGANFVNEMNGSAEFYLNRVLKDFKEKDAKHVEWVKSVKAIFVALKEYINEFHKSGLTWNQSGPPAPTSVPSGPRAPPGGPGAPPPPPPPAVVPPSAVTTDSKPATAALFSEINMAGTNIASGLRKVTDDQKTHKNPNLRASSVVKDKPKPTIAKKPVAVTKKPPVFELQGKKWMVEHQEGNKNLTIEGSMSQVVYIYSCKDSVVIIKGKINSITLDNCKKCAVVFDDAIATVEFVNCQSVQCQVNGKVPTVSIDKTDGCQVYLSKDSLQSEIVTAKSSEMNILVQQADGDYVENPLPEQYKSVWDGKAFVTTPVASHG
ncbi:adenylyl cyclase-associated protein 1 [Nematostella vectensis]|uniref:adenylyl cyclase-associated protein 1 n=1 Tax=Nematostella vectensis TaxID=45351 RepID=UPI0020775C36|nr:adenylyl cyclase-associated protein 1 [Nematostella vectensis]